MKKWYQQIGSVILPPVILFAIVLVLWHVLVEVNEVESYLVPCRLMFGMQLKKHELKPSMGS